MEEAKKKTGWIFSAVNLALCVLLIPVILINVTVIISSYIHPEEIPGVFGVKPVAVLSGSMEDTFRTGDLIFVQKTGTASLKENDVICYLQDGQAVTHRIVGVERGEDGTISYITKGDANNTEDRERVKPEQVQGVWNGGKLGGMGNFVMFLSSTTGMIVFIVCPILLLILWDVIRRWQADKKEKSRAAELEAELNALKAAQNTQRDSQEEPKL
ncbi:signal peptidase I [Zongyangia hominis]|uniref:Signal peptidase I n=1 Tax=Zongyangia hominis TaxID=2763677 RepID=A0A926I702_9FIRM|nr:signal peptidase I [Zongyangia hominis]MBC8570584.1 signal peptidase I [Zongyangia hominis]